MKLGIKVLYNLPGIDTVCIMTTNNLGEAAIFCKNITKVFTAYGITVTVYVLDRNYELIETKVYKFMSNRLVIVNP
jgi:hypothetical protein